MREQGIRTAGQLAALDPISVRRRYGLTVARTVLELQGISCIEEMPGEEETRSITCSRSFGHPVCQEAELVESIACHTAQAAVKLRKLGLTAAGANLFLQAYPDPGKEYWEGESFSSTVAFSRATDDTGHMLQALRPHVHALWRPGKRYRKSGVLFWGLEKGGNRQPDFFKQEPEQESSRLFQAVDALNRRFGKNAVFPLSMGIQRVWQAKREHVTPGYTTRWDQLLTVK